MSPEARDGGAARDPRTSLLAREARDGVRALALDWINRLSAANARLQDQPEDPEALHQARVAITRLRATLRIYQESLAPGLGKRAKQELRALNRSLGRVRDLDVRMEWLRTQESSFDELAREGAALLTDAATRKRSSHLRRVAPALARHFSARVDSWRHRLMHYQVARTVGELEPVQPLAALVVTQLHSAVQQLERRIAQAARGRTQDELHEARIAFKRVRALLVPWLDQVPSGRPLYKILTDAQDTLGDMRDTHLLAREAASAAAKATAAAGTGKHEAAAVRQSRMAECLNALAQHFEQLSNHKRAQFESKWIDQDGVGSLVEVSHVAHALTAAAGQQTEIERKFLLREAPARALTASGVRIAQGWLPGEQLRERLRRSVHADGRVQWTRTVKVGTGISRVEVEEPTEPMLFETLWPLTSAARIEKVRYAVPDGAFVWEIDVFLDRGLVLAEVELPSVDTLVTLPDWLAPHVIRDVTGESEYVNANLARSKTT